VAQRSEAGHSRLWIAAGIAALAVRTAVTLILGNGIALSGYHGLSYLFFLLLAAYVSTLNAIQGRQLELEVVDRGVEFDVDKAAISGGLGFVNMAERIHVLNGNIKTESRPDAGTRIHAHVSSVERSKSVDALCIDAVRGTDDTGETPSRG
jgi:hypothetical protein